MTATAPARPPDGEAKAQRPGRRPPAAAALAAAGLILLAACGRPAPPAAVGAASPAAAPSGPLAFSACMRAHGVPGFPDPGGGGGLPKEGARQLGVSTSRLQAAQGACRHLLPDGGSGPGPAGAGQMAAEALRFSQCMRAHGVPAFPDPDPRSGRIPDPASLGIDQGSPQFQAANRACRAYRPPYIPSNAAYDAYARAHGA